MNIKLFFKYILLIILSISISSCSYFNKKNEKKEEVEKEVIKKKKRDHNLKKRAEEYEGGIIFGKKGIFSGSGTAAQFAAENVLWRASIETLDFVPLITANYSGGIIITDWYSNSKSNDSIKIQVNFNSNELKASSLQIKSFKKVCGQLNQSCKISNLNNNFNSKIKNQILETAKNIKIKLEETKK
jgi:hypothetical protein